MSSAIVFAFDQVKQYDDIVDALRSHESAALRTESGESYEIPRELLDVIVEAAWYLARDKAVSVTPHSRTRFA